MFESRDNNAETLVTGVFCEVFSAAEAVRALNESGFQDEDINLIGVLSGRAPDLRGFLRAMGVPAGHAAYYNACFEHGAVLITVKTPPSYRKKIAIRLLRQCGGTFPAEG